MFRSTKIFALALTALLTLAACESSEERAEKHYAAALALLEEGDSTRALVELRNVFKLNTKHLEARHTYARVQRERGNDDAAFGQYLRLVEQYPQDAGALKALSEISLVRMDWASLQRFAPRALEAAPQDAELEAMAVLAQYLDARTSDDDAAAQAAVEAARDIVTATPDDIAARQVLLDRMLQEQDYARALNEIDVLVAQRPDNLFYQETRLRILGTLQDLPAMGEQLEVMIAQFPENEQIRELLISYYIQQNQMDKAEAFLRKLVAEATPDDRRGAEATLVRFIETAQGVEAAIAELDQIIASRDEALFHETLRAQLIFRQGDREAAIANLRAAIEGRAQSLQLSDSKASLAQMVLVTGDEDAARALVGEVLEADAGHVQALQMRAAWMIEDDKAGAAIQVLRNALDQKPRDARTLSLMAQAHLREGNRELAGERMALAVEASNAAPLESLRYAQFLAESDRLGAAEQVLLPALRKNGTNVDLLEALGKLYFGQEDWIGVEGVIRQLDLLDTDRSKGVANALRNALLTQRDQTGESTAFLQDLIDRGEVGAGASILVVQNMLKEGDVQGAEAYLADLLAESPEDRLLRFVRAGLYVATGDIPAAEAIYRALISENAADSRPYMALYGVLLRSGRRDEAQALLDAGIAATGGNVDMLFAKAGALEKAGDAEAAIEIYETLYEANTGNLILANNLASMITSYRDDEDSLQRAAVVAQRLRGTDVPAFQDTYGWIEYRRGNIDTAIEYLEPAATGLPGNPMVQMHLGMAYIAAERPEEARTALTRALEIGGDPTPAALAPARAALEALSAPATDQ